MTPPQCHGVSNHWQYDCMCNSFFRLTSDLHITGLLWGESNGDWWFLEQSRWWEELFLTPCDSDAGVKTWWRNQMEIFFASGEPPVTGEFPSQRLVTRSFDVFFDLRLNKRLSKQSRLWWYGTPLRSLWRHCYGVIHFLRQTLALWLTIKNRRMESKGIVTIWTAHLRCQ